MQADFSEWYGLIWNRVVSSFLGFRLPNGAEEIYSNWNTINKNTMINSLFQTFFFHKLWKNDKGILQQAAKIKYSKRTRRYGKQTSETSIKCSLF